MNISITDSRARSSYVIDLDDSTLIVNIDRVGHNRMSYALLVMKWNGEAIRMTVPQLCEILDNIAEGRTQ